MLQRKVIGGASWVVDEEAAADFGDANAGIALSLARGLGNHDAVMAFLACRWPAAHHHPPATATRGQTTHVALIADPQLTDRYSYRFTSKGGVLADAIQFYSDLYMRRSFYFLQRHLVPTHVFVLGDLLDSTKWLKDEEYEGEVERYRRVFSLVDPVTRMYTISGSVTNVASLTERYERTFGPINNRVRVGEFEFVLLSSAALEMEEWDQRSYDKTIAFLQDIRNAGASPLRPRVLLTHVPLWRPQTASCGPLRKNSPQIPDSQGFSYKCLVAPHLSRRIIDDVRPVYVFSGDDHDQCVVLHSSTEPTRSFFDRSDDDEGRLVREWNTTFLTDELGPGETTITRVTHAVERGSGTQATGPIRVGTRWARPDDRPPRDQGSKDEASKKSVGIPEQTVGTFSFLQGNLRPSFAMLSLHSSDCNESHHHHGSGGRGRLGGSWWRCLALELVVLLLACLSLHLFFVILS
ncbi:uncharacterized protein ACA1_092000 [Acanthamoeba castellanii str. Neff]|uniref:Calcineurin-like phosphoesterase domain-containing protein n=1 Tax=Acanthamoeba castellanii (strain ATCC 30010 / Neff) TaxID=1257118 RepID=L8GHZ5_ACACF|nr:uncharacterized protein ACA1_092000 [Acanthamoeba castellanii str. Neff]ELR12690.1 hypothetical protein ACA1_092000 [Acanthamoeba castellanii str. Neff]